MAVVKDDYKDSKLLLVDKEGIHQMTLKSKLNIGRLNEGFECGKSIFQDTPDNNELLTAMINGGFKGVEELIKKKSGYPDGELTTILNLWGRLDNYRRAKELMDGSFFSFLKYNDSEYIFENGKFRFNENVVKDFEKLCTYHTKNKTQNITLDIIEKLCEPLNLALDMGVIYHDKNPINLNATVKIRVVRAISKFLKVENDRVVPDLWEIYRIKE